jgi:hypothetical protein
LKRYMDGPQFNPELLIDVEKIKALTE